MIKKVISGIVIIVVLVLAFIAVQKPAIIQTGSVSSPEISSNWFSFAGIKHWGAKTTSLTQATTTVCALQSPVSTSTLQFASIRFSVSSTTATTVTMAKATTPYATTTVLVASALGANAQGTLVSSSTPTSGASLDGTYVFAPSTYLVVGMAGGTGTFSPTGVCEAVWIEN